MFESFNNDRSIEDARVIDGPVAQFEIVDKPIKPIIMEEIVTEPSEELDISLKRPMPLNESIRTEEPSLEEQQQVSHIEPYIWSPNNLDRFTRNLKVMRIGARDRYNRRKMSEFYGEIVEAMKEQCSEELRRLNVEFYGENVKLYNQIHQYLSKEDVIEMKRRKEEIRWEFAW